jgi:small-conductance mechanosensitive channel
MPGRTEVAVDLRRGVRALRALALVVLLLAAAAVAQAQAPVDPAAAAKRWDEVASAAEARVADETTTTDDLEALREQLVAQRSEIGAVEQQNQPAVDELNQRLQALGPPPAEGADEAPEIATLRRELNQKIADAQAPVLTAQEAFKRVDSIVNAIDRIVRQRFSDELMARAPSPLLPSTWQTALADMGDSIRHYTAFFADDVAEPRAFSARLVQAPVRLALVLAGLGVAFVVRRRLLEWVERHLAATTNRKSIAWLVAVRNLARLVVPAVGAGLFFAAFDPSGLLVRADEGRFFALPPFVLILIGAGWLAGSLLTPGNRALGLVPLEAGEARQGTRLIFALGVAVSLSFLFSGLSLRWNLATATQGTLQVLPVLLGSAVLWRIARLAERTRLRVHLAAETDDSQGLVALGLRFVYLAVRLVRGVAIAGPVLAILGYVPAASFLVIRTALTLGTLGAMHVVFDLLNKTAQGLLAGPTGPSDDDDGSLTPIIVGTVVALAALPIFALIWGARPSEIVDFWTMMRDGVTLGGIRLSATALLMLVVVFALGFGLTRLIQTILRGTVLPRTRLDAGGKNAVLAGVGYVGFAVAGLAAVSAAGLDLSSLAIVAGALSVGIGFGLQNVVSNFVSGIILLVERPVKEGDWIEVGGFSGYVKGINVRSTEIQTFDRASVILPNTDLIAGTVLNRTHTGISGRLQVPVSTTYDADPRKVEAILLELADQHPLILEDPAPRVLFLALGPDTMDFELRCWLRDVNFSLSARSDLNFEIMDRFSAEGIRTRFYGRETPPEPPGPPAAVRGALILPEPGTQPHLKAPEQQPAARPPVAAGHKP